MTESRRCLKAIRSSMLRHATIKHVPAVGSSRSPCFFLHSFSSPFHHWEYRGQQPNASEIFTPSLGILSFLTSTCQPCAVIGRYPSTGINLSWFYRHLARLRDHHLKFPISFDPLQATVFSTPSDVSITQRPSRHYCLEEPVDA